VHRTAKVAGQAFIRSWTWSSARHVSLPGRYGDVMVATYDRHGISFVYPENWAFSEESQDADSHCVMLQSPGSGFWMLQLLQTAKSPEILAAEALHSVEQEYDDIEVVRVEEEIEGVRSVGYDLLFYCLDFIVSSRVRSFSVDRHSFVLLWQAEDQEFEKTSPVFAAITASLLSPAKRMAALNNNK